MSKKQLEHDGVNITVLAHAHFILKKVRKINELITLGGQAVIMKLTSILTEGEMLMAH